MTMREKIRTYARLHLLKASHRLMSLTSGGGRRRIAMDPLDTRIICDLETEGVHVTSLDKLLPELKGLPEVMDRARALAAGTHGRAAEAQWRSGASSTDLTAASMIELVPELYLLGLQPRLLQLVENYLRLPAAYHGGVVRHSFVDGGQAGPRIWHRDFEDFHVFRAVLYLNDVTEGGGPFEYIPRPLSPTHKQVRDVGPLTSETMQGIVPASSWKRCYGPAGTLVLCDTAMTYHHESLQTQRDRMVVMFGYSSRQPSRPTTSQRHFPVERVRDSLMRIVPAANRPHVFDWRSAKAAAILEAEARQD